MLYYLRMIFFSFIFFIFFNLSTHLWLRFRLLIYFFSSGSVLCVSFYWGDRCLILYCNLFAGLYSLFKCKLYKFLHSLSFTISNFEIQINYISNLTYCVIFCSKIINKTTSIRICKQKLSEYYSISCFIYFLNGVFIE